MEKMGSRADKLAMHHQQYLWAYWSLILAGIWMMLSPLTFQYGLQASVPAGGREVWLSLPWRACWLSWSDWITGALLIYFGWRSLVPDRPASVWICCALGLWLSFAPLLFWAPSAAAYLNGTFTGMLVIAFSILIPGMPNAMVHMQPGPDVPAGWSYNPSSWSQRWILILLGFGGMMTSRYLAAYQLGYIGSVWDPIFGEGSRRVLESRLSQSWPVSDAGLGAFSYTLEFLMGFMGGKMRWRTMPWMVTLFGILVIPLGLTHIFLVISQPLLVGSWCSFCLLAALFMLPMIPLEVDEVIAMSQFLARAKKNGRPFWATFWQGGTEEGGGEDQRSPELLLLPRQPWNLLRASCWGMSHSATLWAMVALGAWLAFSPLMLGLEGSAANLDHVVGLLIIVFSVIAMGEVVRIGRYLNALIGLGLMAASLTLDSATTLSRCNDVLIGAFILLLSYPRGPQKENYGAWNRFIR